jgi:glycosyltransferase involved in cell wall biosynthesis
MEEGLEMKVTVTLEVRFDVLPDGSVWTLSNFHRSFWDRYLEVFSEVEIVARANAVESISSNAKRVDESGKVNFKPIPFYLGPFGYLKKWRKIRSQLKKVEKEAEAIVLRVGSPIADILHPILISKSHPYALEVVGDPHDTFAPGSTKSIFRPLYRWWFSKKLKSQARNASAISYVTSVRLPQRYSPLPNTQTIFASSIDLRKEQIAQCPKSFNKDHKKFRLISVGALEDFRKGPDTALLSLSELLKENYDVTLTWVGGGRSRSKVEELAAKLGLSDRVTFKGQLPSGEAIFKVLDEADIFILPTRGEGLPRAMIEAMARGLVCAGSDVGGIPELLAPEFLHSPQDEKRLTYILKKFITDPELMNRESRNNWNKSQNYLAPELQERRKRMYLNLKGITDEWKKNNSIR